MTSGDDGWRGNGTEKDKDEREALKTQLVI